MVLFGHFNYMNRCNFWYFFEIGIASCSEPLQAIILLHQLLAIPIAAIGNATHPITGTQTTPGLTSLIKGFALTIRSTQSSDEWNRSDPGICTY